MFPKATLSQPVAISTTRKRVMASNEAAMLFTIVAFLATHIVHSTDYILGDLNKCTRVPDEPPCNIPYERFVPDYASRRYEILLETIYRKAKDISRLDSRPQCVNAYRAFLCAQLFPRCRKYQNPSFQNLDMKRWVVHDPAIRSKCSKIFESCNERVVQRFMSSDYFLCDHVEYTPDGWESDRCVLYDEDTRCPVKYGKLPLWYLNYHDQNLVEYLNATRLRLNHTLPYGCFWRLLQTICRHPVCSADSKYMVTNYTREQCERYIMCARFVPGEINVDAVCLLFPSSTMTVLASLTLVLTTLFLQHFMYLEFF